MPAQLVALNDGPNILVDKPILLVGRHPECDIQIDSRKISRRHCCIAQVNDYLVVRDLDSTNGIRINGVRVVEGKIHNDDELTIGSHRYRVSWEEAVPPRLPRSPVARIPTPNVPVPPSSLPDNEDDMLEECDEPVPLPDPGGRPFGDDRTAHRPMREESLHIPENLELAPGSGSYPDLGLPPRSG